MSCASPERLQAKDPTNCYDGIKTPRLWCNLGLQVANAAGPGALMNSSLRIAGLAALGMAATISSAQVFVPGTLIIGRSGNGAALGNLGVNGYGLFASSKLIGPSGLLNAFAPDNGTAGTATATSFTTSGSATSDGYIGRGPNGIFLGLGGYSSSSAAGSVATSATVNRRLVGVPFTAGVANNPSYNFSTVTDNTAPNALTGNNCRMMVTADGQNYYIASALGLFYHQAGAANALQLLTTVVSVRQVFIAGGSLWYGTNTGLFRLSGLPTTAGQVGTQVVSGTSLYGVSFLDGQNMLLADDTPTTGGLRLATITGAGVNWGNVSTGLPVTTTQLNNTAIRGLASDGIRAYATNTTTSNNNLLSYPTLSGTPASVTLDAAGTNNAFRGVALAPEPSVVNAAYSGTSGVQRIALRHQGTATDPFVRSVRVANVNFSSWSAAATLATVGYRGQIVDMAVDNVGNTIMLNVVPDATFTGYVYSIIRVSADGTQTDEGPLSAGAPSQVAPTGFIPVAIAGNPSSNSAAVLMWSPAANVARLGIVTLPPAFGGGVTTVADWGPYLAASAAHRAADVAFTSTGTPRILFSTLAAGVGSYEVLNADTASTQSSFCTGGGIANLRALSLTVEPGGNIRLLQSGSDNGRPNQFRVDTATSGSVAPSTVGTQYTQDSSTNNPVTSQPIWNQMWAVSVNWDVALARPNVVLAGSNGSLVPSALTTEPRLNVPGSYRGWALNPANNNVAFATYRFFPGINVN